MRRRGDEGEVRFPESFGPVVVLRGSPADTPEDDDRKIRFAEQLDVGAARDLRGRVARDLERLCVACFLPKKYINANKVKPNSNKPASTS